MLTARRTMVAKDITVVLAEEVTVVPRRIVSFLNLPKSTREAEPLRWTVLRMPDWGQLVYC